MIQRQRPKLKVGAVPTIFPNCPSYLSKKIPCRKPPAPREQCPSLLPEQCHTASLVQCASEVTEFSSNALTVLSSGALPLQSSNALSMQCSSGLPQEMTYALLCEKLNDVQKPNDWWTVSACKEYVIYVKWDQHYKAERKVIVCKNLSAKVVLRFHYFLF